MQNGVQNEYRVIVHHYEENTTTSVAEDEEIIGALGESYTTRNLIPTLDGQGNIQETDGREYLNPAEYTCVGSVGNTTGTFTLQDIVVTYYYRATTFEISGEAGVGGSISNVDETVRYGGNSTKAITITPDIGNKVQEIRVNNQVVTGYTENQTTKVVTLQVFTNVTENKHITVTFMPVPKVAKIIEVPEGYEALLNTEYEYLSQAIGVVPANVESFTIQIINNVTNETNTINNKYIKIDLNGYDVTGSSLSSPTLKIESGSLQVVGLGRVINDLGNAVEIEPGGTFTLGEDDDVVSQFAPIIEGKQKGVIKKSETNEQTGETVDGIFNFYDGVIRGENAALEGAATDTPRLYDPSTYTNEQGKIETILDIVSGIEALIGKTRYIKLEQAINAANNIKGTSQEQIEIDVVADIGTNEGTDPNRVYELDNTKNIKLDLNGHTITTGLNNYVITNKGKLEIIDSSYVPANGENEEVAGTGNILSTTSHTILNTNNGELTVTSGTITSTLSGKYAIHNSGSGKLTVNGGKVESTGNTSSAGAKAIYSEGTSEIIVNQNAYIKGTENAIYTKDSTILTINGGTIESDNKGTYGYTVYHTANANAVIAGGTINVQNGYAIGFYNSKTATNTVTITGGTVTSEKGGIINKGNTQITISNINITSKSNSYAVSNENSNGIIYINGGTYGSTYNGLFYNSGTMTVTAGTYILNSAAVGENYGTLTISNLTFDNANYGIKNSSGGTLNLTNVTINSTNLAVENAGTLTMNNVTISSTNARGVTNASTGKINMVEGTITSKERGIENNGGTVTLGTKDGNVSDTDIIIESSTKEGIYSTGSISYYDGTIKGIKTLGAIVGRVNEIETGKNILITENGNVQIANLGVQNYIAQIGTAKYTNLRDAVSACPENTEDATEIVIINDFHVTGSEFVTIPANKNIKINLDGHTITSNCVDEMIQNLGTLTIRGNTDNVVYYDGQYQQSIETAITLINNSARKKGTIFINADLMQENQIVIPEGADITFVMQGYSIVYDGADAAILNNGKLTIIDDEQEEVPIDPDKISMVINTNGIVIQNNGQLILGINGEPNNTNSPIILGGVSGNTPIIYDGEVKLLDTSGD